MKITIPELSLVTLIGVSSAGKSTFAQRFFKETEIVSSDYCRAMVSDDENSLSSTQDAFDLAHFIIGKRLKRGNLTVMDATNVKADARKPLIALCKKHHVVPVAIILDTDKKVCKERNEQREDRDLGDYVINRQYRQIKQSVKNLKKEGYRFIYTITPEDIKNIEIERQKMYSNKKEVTNPLDFIGDVHGCFDELTTLLKQLNYTIETHKDKSINYGYTVTPPEDRKAVFVGDLTDRGPRSNEVLRLVMSMVKTKSAYVVCGNHDFKLHKKLSGKNVNLKHGLAETVEQLKDEPQEFINEARDFLKGLISHYIFDEGRVVVAHAGLREEMHGRGSGQVRNFCMFGETTGEVDEFGLPIRLNWAKEYQGKAIVIYGHTPVPKAEWFNNTMDIDTGCVFGGSLTALRYPEKEIISVPANKMYCEPSKPLEPIEEKIEDDGMVHIEDVTGQKFIDTELMGSIKINEANSIAALEVMSRFAIDPKWLTYLPPTMSPCETSELKDYLEHPQEALKYFKENNIQKVVCEEKHMGSRAIITVCQNEKVAREIFGAKPNEIGIIYSRKGRAFFDNKGIEQQLLARVQKALSKSRFWEKFKTQWVTLDCELMPWSAKAQSLLEKQYGATGIASKIALSNAEKLLVQAKNRGINVDELSEQIQVKKECTQLFTKAYRNYCWDVNSLEDYKIAPFHVLATEGKVHHDQNHEWHMTTIHEICKTDPAILLATNYKIIDLSNETEKQEVIDWWLAMTEKGGEGMVIKPYDFVVKTPKSFVQPAVKCRGREYLRIIYGPEYTSPGNLQKLKHRNLGGKRALAKKEFSLGIASLQRFVEKKSLRKVHECVFGVLALESEAIDPRL